MAVSSSLHVNLGTASRVLLVKLSWLGLVHLRLGAHSASDDAHL